MWLPGAAHACILLLSAESTAHILCLQVGYQMTTEAAKRSVDPFPSLSGYTVSVWFRACCEQLQVGMGRAVPHWLMLPALVVAAHLAGGEQ